MAFAVAKGATMSTEKKRGKEAPDPATVYGREKPEAESGMGRLTNNRGTPTNRPDEMPGAVTNKQPLRQINTEDVDRTGERSAGGMRIPEPVERSMFDEEPDGEDLTPTEKRPNRQRRHPRTEGKGGTPDATDRRRR